MCRARNASRGSSDASSRPDSAIINPLCVRIETEEIAVICKERERWFVTERGIAMGLSESGAITMAHSGAIERGIVKELLPAGVVTQRGIAVT